MIRRIVYVETKVQKALIVAAAFGMISKPAFAQNSEAQPDWIEQAKIVANMQGISVGEAVRRARLQDKVNRTNERFLADPDYAGAWIEQDARGFRATFAFRNGKKPSLGDQELQDAATFSAAARSIAELRQARNELMKQLRANGLTAAYSEVVQTQRLELWPDQPDQLRSFIVAGKVSVPEFVDVKTVSVTPKFEYDVYGSGSMALTDGTRCTGGFVVSNGTNRGISTAGHCSNPPKVTTHRDQPVGSLMGTSLFKAGNGLDVSWYRNSTYMYLNRARITSSSYYSITTVAPQVPVAGTTVCVLRRVNPETCTKVITNYTYTTSTGAPDGPYIVTEAYVTEGSDSGAPWLYGGWAYGIHLGSTTYLNVARSIYSPAASLPRMGLQVVTQP